MPGFRTSNSFEPYSLAPDQALYETKAKSLPITSSISRIITKFGFKRARKKVVNSPRCIGSGVWEEGHTDVPNKRQKLG